MIETPWFAVRRLVGWTAAVAGLRVALGLAVGCGGRGGEGEQCTFMGGVLGNAYSCDEGLVCNTGGKTLTCERPNVHSVGEVCGADENCKTGLWCDRQECAMALQAGQRCPSGTGCGAGLECIKVGNDAFCAPGSDAGGVDAAVE